MKQDKQLSDHMCCIEMYGESRFKGFQVHTPISAGKRSEMFSFEINVNGRRSLVCTILLFWMQNDVMNSTGFESYSEHEILGNYQSD